MAVAKYMSKLDKQYLISKQTTDNAWSIKIMVIYCLLPVAEVIILIYRRRFLRH